jgi:hypothetical protein
MIQTEQPGPAARPPACHCATAHTARVETVIVLGLMTERLAFPHAAPTLNLAVGATQRNNGRLTSFRRKLSKH